MKKHINIKITGQVQMVLFRHSTKEIAQKLGLKGFVRNEPDGSVYIEVEGSEGPLRELISWCYGGPEAARVDNVDIHEGQMQNFKQFYIG